MNPILKDKNRLMRNVVRVKKARVARNAQKWANYIPANSYDSNKSVQQPSNPDASLLKAIGFVITIVLGVAVIIANLPKL